MPNNAPAGARGVLRFASAVKAGLFITPATGDQTGPNSHAMGSSGRYARGHYEGIGCINVCQNRLVVARGGLTFTLWHQNANFASVLQAPSPCMTKQPPRIHQARSTRIALAFVCFPLPIFFPVTLTFILEVKNRNFASVSCSCNPQYLRPCRNPYLKRCSPIPP